MLSITNKMAALVTAHVYFIAFSCPVIKKLNVRVMRLDLCSLIHCSVMRFIYIYIS